MPLSCVLAKCLRYCVGTCIHKGRPSASSCVPNTSIRCSSVRLHLTSARMLFCCGLGGNRSKGSPRSSKFDEKGFRDNVQDLGRAYRHRSIELIKTCQTLSVASTQKFEQDLKLTKYLPPPPPTTYTSRLTSLRRICKCVKTMRCSDRACSPPIAEGPEPRI